MEFSIVLKIAGKQNLLKIVAGGALVIALATGAWAKPKPPYQAPEVNPVMIRIEGILAAAGVTVLVLARRRKKSQDESSTQMGSL
jgi:hypothetical protein